MLPKETGKVYGHSGGGGGGGGGTGETFPGPHKAFIFMIFTFIDCIPTLFLFPGIVKKTSVTTYVLKSTLYQIKARIRD